MQYRLAILALAGLAAAQSSTDSSAAAGSTSGVSPQETQCLNSCAASDVNCRAQCVNVPFPNESQANANVECARQCDQGDGSPSATEAYGKCLAQCASQHYYTSSGTLGSGSGTAPTAVPAGGASSGASSNASSTGTGAAASNTGASMSNGSGTAGGNTQSSGSQTSGTAGAQQTGSNTSAQSSSTSHSGAAATLMPMGMMGVAMAVLAL